MIINKVFAQTATTIPDPLAGRFDNLGDVFGFVVNLVIGIGWGIVFVMVALGFIQYVTSKGDKTAVDTAKNWLTYAIIGGVGLFFVGFLRRVIPDLLGVSGGPAEGVLEGF